MLKTKIVDIVVIENIVIENRCVRAANLPAIPFFATCRAIPSGC